MKISTIIAECKVKDTVSTDGIIVRALDVKKVKNRYAKNGEREQQTLIIAESEENKNTTLGYFYKDGPPWFSREHQGEQFSVEGATIASEYEGNFYLDKGKVTASILTTEPKQAPGKPEKKPKIKEDYVTMACGFTVIWTEIMRRFELPSEAIDPIAKRVDTVTILNNGINLDRVRVLGQPIARELVIRSIEFQDDVAAEYGNQTRSSEPSTKFVNGEEAQKMRELCELAIADSELTEEKMAKLLKTWGAAKLDEVPKEQFETVCAYLKEWRTS